MRSLIAPPLFLLCCLVVLFPAGAAERPPLRIEADRVTLDETAGVSIYQGGVQAEQGPLRLLADELRLYRRDGRLARVEADGRPAVFRRQDSPPLVAKARRIVYLVLEGRVILSGEARLEQGRDRFEGGRIEYDLSERRVLAEGGEGEGRVRVILSPETVGGTEVPSQ